MGTGDEVITTMTISDPESRFHHPTHFSVWRAPHISTFACFFPSSQHFQRPIRTQELYRFTDLTRSLHG